MIYAYKNGSGSAKLLSEALGIKRIKHEGKPLKLKKLINWGSSAFTRNMQIGKILNLPECVRNASHKIRTFEHIGGLVNIPDWTLERKVAEAWIKAGQTVVCRTLIQANSGKGIVIAENVNELVDAPLYTKYIPKKEEYRIHVFQGEAFHVQRKARKKDVPDDKVNWKVRSHGNGFCFQIQGIEMPEAAAEQAVKAVQSLGLDFGAVDLIWNQKEDKWYVLEVNTAPGIEATTLAKYVEQFKKVM